MRYFNYIEPGAYGEPLTYIVSEEQIMESYFEHWKQKMVEAGKENKISEKACLDDWITVNWAWEVEGATKIPLSARVRPSSEVAPWVYDEIVSMEKERDLLQEAFKVLEELQECSYYWSEYDVPLGIHERIDTVIKNVRDVKG